MVSALTNSIYRELQELENEFNPDEIEKVFAKYAPMLHPDHFHLTGMKHSLSQVTERICYQVYLLRNSIGTYN